jgi:hypothetical protein
VLPLSWVPPPFAAILPFVARAGRCAGGIADDIPGDPGAIAAGGGGYGVSAREGLGGKLRAAKRGRDLREPAGSGQGRRARARTLGRGRRGNRERGNNRYAAQEMLHVSDPLLKFRTTD